MGLREGGRGGEGLREASKGRLRRGGFEGRGGEGGFKGGGGGGQKGRGLRKGASKGVLCGWLPPSLPLLLQARASRRRRLHTPHNHL